MTARLNPYLSFRDNARQAMEFYQTVFGGKLDISTFGDVPDVAKNHDVDDSQVMHAMLEGDHGIILMGADTPPEMPLPEQSAISVSLSGDDEGLLTRWWEQLSGSGQVTVPLEKAPWGDSFGMCVDQFGVSWLVNIAGSPE
jgi:PhnB protein